MLGGSQKSNQPNGIDILGSGTRDDGIWLSLWKLYATHNANTYTEYSFLLLEVYEISTTPVDLLQRIYNIALPDKSLSIHVSANKAGIIIVSRQFWF